MGINTDTPTEKLHVEGGDILVSDTNGIVFTDIQNSAGPALRISAGTDTQITRFMISEDGGSGMFLGQRGFSEVSFPSGSSLGKQGDGFLYSGNDQNGLNIISQPGTGTDDYIRFFVGQAVGAAGTPDLYIQGSGSTRGNVGINNESPTSKLDISGTTGYQQLRLRTNYTPSSTADTNGAVGDIAWDNNYLYIKTSTGWGRLALDYAF